MKTISKAEMVQRLRERWRMRCPRDHLLCYVRSLVDGWYCRECNRTYSHLLDAKKDELVKGTSFGGM